MTRSLRAVRLYLSVSLVLLGGCGALSPDGGARAADAAPVPLLAEGKSVDWWFVYKFNAQTVRQCDADIDPSDRPCPFGGKPAPYKNSQAFAVASKDKPSLTKGSACAGTADPVATTFEQIYKGKFHYLVWNDQFYKEPKVRACNSDGCAGSWGHSKGVLAWNDDGEGVVVQVTTPAWPGFASKKFTRKGGNTLGCIKRPNNVQNAQHFFAVKLNKDDVVHVLDALENSSVVTDTSRSELVNTGGPQEIKDRVKVLGQKSDSTEVKQFKLSTGITLVSKPSALHVPPWQMLSSVLDSVDLKAATWWASPQIPTTNGPDKVKCWDESLTKEPGSVEIAVTGTWEGEPIGLVGGQNHAKVGVSISGKRPLSIFADLNQQGALSGNCKSSQNGRGGMFFVLEQKELFDDMTKLLDGKIASTTPPKKKIKVKQ